MALCRELGYPVFSKDHWMRTGKDRVQVEATNVAVNIGDARVQPGDIVRGDADGVVVIPKEHEDKVLDTAEEVERPRTRSAKRCAAACGSTRRASNTAITSCRRARLEMADASVGLRVPLMQIDPNSYFAKLRRFEAPLPAIAATLGARITAVDLDEGTLDSEYVAGPGFLNPAGQVQGGMLAAMLDDVTAFLVTATLAERESCATLNLNVSFLRPARPGPLLGRARLVRRGGTVCNVVGELLQDGRQVATAVATCMVVGPG